MRAFTPRAYQQRALQFMLDTPKCALFADMGMGKTSAALALIDTLTALDGRQHTLVIAPKRVATITWPNEIAAWEDFRALDYSVIAGDAAARRAALRRNAQIHIINFDNIPWLLNELGTHWPFHTVIADESSKLKSHAAVRFRGHAARKRVVEAGVVVQEARPATRGLKHVAHRSTRWVNLTGTPTPNGLMGLWSQIYLLDGGQRLGRTITAFRDRWFYPNRDAHRYIPLPGAQADILSRISDVCLTLRANDFFDLPPLIVEDVPVELPKAAKAAYARLQREFALELDGKIITAVNAAVLSGKLLQAANGAIYTERGNSDAWAPLHDEKLDALDEIVEEASSPVMVAYNFKSDLARLREAYPEARVMDNDPRTLRDWNEGRVPMLLIHPDSAGHGLNLQYGGNTLVFFSLTWNLESYQQVIERIGPTRQKQSGLDRPVFVYRILARGTIDAAVAQCLAGKANVQDAVKAYMRGQLSGQNP